MSNKKPTYQELEKKVLELEAKLSKHKKAQQILNESEARFKNMFLHHNAIMLLIEPETGAIIDANDAAARFYGYSKSALCSLKINDINMLSPEQIAKEQKKAINEKGHHFIFPHKLANGEIHTVEVHSSPIKFQNKRILFLIIYDITERKIAEKALKESEQKFKSLFSSSADAILLADAETGIIVDANDAAELLFEKPIDEIIGMHQKDLHPQEKKEHSEKTFKHRPLNHLSGTPPVEIEIITDNNNQKTVEIRGRIIHLNNKEFVLGNFRDITERKITEQTLKNSLIDLQLAENIARIGNWQFNPRIGVPVWSDEIYNIYERDSKLGPPQIKEHHNIYDEQQYEIFISAFNNAVNEGIPYDIILKLKLPENRIKWVRAICKPQQKIINAGHFLRGTIQDITTQREHEIQLQNYSQELKKLNKDKDKFMSILAHDLKNPFNALLGFSDLLVENIREYDIDTIEQYIQTINEVANNAYSILEDILEWSFAKSANKNYNPSDFPLHELCNKVIEQEENLAQPKNIALKSNVSPQINVSANKNTLSTVLRNLVSNAIKFTKESGTVTINAKETENEVVVSVEDTGVGIKQEMVSKIFDAASISSTTGTANEKGTGLGLQICKEFIVQMGGEIGVKSEEGKGSVFYFAIPKLKKEEKTK